MNCKNCLGTGNCAYNIMLPYYVRYCGEELLDKPEIKYVTIDKCLLPEIINIWEMGVKTTGCCCGHGDKNMAFISVRKEYSKLMLDMGYKLFPHGDNDHFRPQLPCFYADNIQKGHNWWDEYSYNRC